MSETPTTTIITSNRAINTNIPNNFYTAELHNYFLSLLHLRRIVPTSFLALLLFLLLTCNGFTTFYIRLPFPAKSTPEPASFSPEKVSGISISSEKRLSSSSSSSSSSSPPATTTTKLSSSVMYAVKEENPPVISKTHLPILQKSTNSVRPVNNTSIRTLKRVRKSKPMFKIRQFEARPDQQFSTRMKDFLGGNGSNSSCKVRFFMTWISSLDSFRDRELFSIQSLFKSHPNGCLIIVSKSMDSTRGMKLLSPFVEKGFRVTAIWPDFNYIFKDTYAESWFNRLMKGNIDPGEVALGQNLSNLLRLALLYKFGGIYIDTDVIVLKSLANLRNVIGAQTMDLQTGNWSRLNNAVMIFDKKHPLLYKFIEEFALTFNGNKWGHNGPYLVSRVVSRVQSRTGFDFTVLPSPAFYPVDWSRIRSLFHVPKDENQRRWLVGKLRHIRKESFAVHLWNRQSRRLKVEDGSIVSYLMSDCCVFCNSSKSAL